MMMIGEVHDDGDSWMAYLDIGPPPYCISKVYLIKYAHGFIVVIPGIILCIRPANRKYEDYVYGKC